MPLLRVDRLTVRFGGVTALDEVSFAVEPGQVCGLIGPNGAGKTTLFNCLSRLYTPDSGEVVVRGRSILGSSPLWNKLAGSITILTRGDCKASSSRRECGSCAA